MTYITNDFSEYDPRNYRSDLPCVIAGLVLFLAVLSALVLV